MPRWLKLVLLFVAVFVGCVPLTWIGAMMLTPVLWRLEGVLHVELAGHSGPSDWVFYVVHALVVAAVFALVMRMMRSGKP